MPRSASRRDETTGRGATDSSTVASPGSALNQIDCRLGAWGFMVFLLATFFLGSAGASSAYLTVSEIFPMETRALAIAFFYATGTAVGCITGLFLFGRMIESGEASQVAIAFFLGAAVMAIGGTWSCSSASRPSRWRSRTSPDR